MLVYINKQHVAHQFSGVVIAALHGRAGEGGHMSMVCFEDAEFKVPLVTIRSGL